MGNDASSTYAQLTYSTFHDIRFSESSELKSARAAVQALRPLRVQATMYVSGPTDVLPDAVEFRAVKGTKKFDLVVLANTLHEIPLNRWQGVFDEIQSVLADNGHVLVIEDQMPPVGELPHQDGFLILDPLELGKLFDADLETVPGANNRLTACLVPRAALGNVCNRTVNAAIEAVKARARREIGRLREPRAEKRSPREGREHALYAMLLVNAQLAQETLPRESPSGPPS